MEADEKLAAMFLQKRAQATPSKEEASSSLSWSTFGPAPKNLSSSFQAEGDNSSPTLGEVLSAVRALKAKVVTKADLADLKEQLLQATKELVETKVQPLQAKLDTLSAQHALLQKKVVELEARKGAGATEQKHNSEDPAFKRVDFNNLSGTDAQARLKAMREYCSKFPGPSPVAVENYYKGPWNNRTLKTKGYAEFADKDAAREFLKAAKGEVELAGCKVAVKAGKTKLQNQRDWALGKAGELLRKEVPDKTVEVKWGNERVVKVDSAVAFKQEKEDEKGTFASNFSHLALP